MAENDRPDIESSKLSQPGDVWVWTAASVLIALLVALAVVMRAPHKTAPQPLPPVNQTRTLPAPLVGGAHANTSMGTRVWNSISLPHDSKATLTTTFKTPDSMDYQFILTGDPDTIRKLFGSHPLVNISILDILNRPIKQFAVDPKKMALNPDGFIMDEETVQLTSDEYNSIADWNVEIRFLKTALPPPPEGTTDSTPASPPAPTPAPAQTMPPVAPNAVAPTVPQSSVIDLDSMNRVTNLEKLLFGVPAVNQPLTDRLDRLENQIFYKTFSNVPTKERVKSLEQSIYGGVKH